MIEVRISLLAQKLSTQLLALVVVAMSGGVDSSVTAKLLADQVRFSIHSSHSYDIPTLKDDDLCRTGL